MLNPRCAAKLVDRRSPMAKAARQSRRGVSCQARISYPKRRMSMPVEYRVTRSDDGKTFQVAITQFGQ